MPLDDKPTQWTVTLSPAPPAGPAWSATARRWLMTALALLAAYWIGTANADGRATPTTPSRPASTQPADVSASPTAPAR